MRQELSRTLFAFFGVSVFAACRVIHKVSRVIGKRKRQFLAIPGYLAHVKSKFYDVGHLANTLVIVVATAVLYNFALIHREQDFVDDIEVENVSFDIVAASDATGNAKRQLIILTIVCLIRLTIELDCM